jgi:hypothetical protein
MVDLKIAKYKRYLKILDVRIPDSRHFWGLGIYIRRTLTLVASVRR